MNDNKKKNDSLRAVGAFKAPSILIKKGEYELSEEIVNLANQWIGYNKLDRFFKGIYNETIY